MRNRTARSAAATAMLTIATVAFWAGLAMAARTPSASKIHLYETDTALAGNRGTVIITGAIADHGKDHHGVAGGGAINRFVLSKGSFELNLRTLEQKLNFPTNPKTCAGGGSATAPATIVKGSGTGAYRGIRGTLKTTAILAWIYPRLANGKSNMNATRYPGVLFGEATGTVSYKTSTRSSASAIPSSDVRRSRAPTPTMSRSPTMPARSSDSPPSTTAYSSSFKTPPQLSLSPPTGLSTLTKTPLRWPGAWDPRTVSQSHVVSTSRPSEMVASARFGRCSPRCSRLRRICAGTPASSPIRESRSPGGGRALALLGLRASRRVSRLPCSARPPGAETLAASVQPTIFRVVARLQQCIATTNSFRSFGHSARSHMAPEGPHLGIVDGKRRSPGCRACVLGTRPDSGA
jgi:hypothetical protein